MLKAVACILAAAAVMKAKFKASERRVRRERKRRVCGWENGSWRDTSMACMRSFSTNSEMGMSSPSGTLLLVNVGASSRFGRSQPIVQCESLYIASRRVSHDWLQADGGVWRVAACKYNDSKKRRKLIHTARNRMDPEMFSQMAEDLTPNLQKKTTNCRRPPSPWTQAGHHSEVSSLWGLSQVTGLWVPCGPEQHRQCCATGACAKPSMTTTTRQPWSVPQQKSSGNEVPQGFSDKWNFRHCCGCIDGKHMRMQAQPHSGSLYYNYKGYYSIIMLALVNAKCKFFICGCGCLWCWFWCWHLTIQYWKIL